MLGDDLTALLSPGGDPEFGFRQGVVVTFNQTTGQNTVDVAGTVLADVPILSGAESLEYTTGDVVVLLRWKSSWAILGRIVTPNSANRLAPSAVAFDSIGASATNFPITTAYVSRVSGTVTVPAWANRMLLHATTDWTAENTTASTDIVTGRAVIDGTGGGTAQTRHAATGAFPERFGTGSPSAVREVAVAGGAVITVSLDLKTTTGNWAASANNIANLNATAIFRRE